MVAVRPVEAINTTVIGQECGGDGGAGGGARLHFSVLMLTLDVVRFRAKLLPHSRPASPRPRPPLLLYRVLLPNQDETSPWMRRLSMSSRTSHIVPVPIHEGQGNELERNKRLESSPHFRYTL